MTSYDTTFSQLAMVTTQNRGDSGGGQSANRSAFGRISSWYMRWLSRKTALPRSEDTVLPCRVVVPADTTYSADEGALATAPGATGAVPVEATRKTEPPLDTGRCADESSTGRQLCTEETSIQPYVERGEAPPPGCEAMDDLSVETELRHEEMTLTKGIQDHGGGFVPESQPLLDAPGRSAGRFSAVVLLGNKTATQTQENFSETAKSRRWDSLMFEINGEDRRIKRLRYG
ncbi:hypothetical protein HPB52_015789 [Rhipicephalus sanguineus]|uniref:Uncharacterized protein n=1 Tax=Rhipicephalus sanguineus TaxID=34632 RepID=A0A9D4T3X5_RHISA|nr:hypothetical protein HPB52_015789 [Rhipicephalus sanguineus]